MARDCAECPVMDRILNDDPDAERMCEQCGEFDNEPTMADGVTPLQW